MNAKQILTAATLCIAAGSAFALPQEYVAPDAGFSSTRSRAEVISEIKTTMSMPGAKDGVYPTLKAQAAVRPNPVTSSARHTGGSADLYFGA
jgi:hypothetical protein